MNNCELCKTKKREETERTKLLNRLKRIEGQVRGIIGMIERDSYCVNILTQVNAINSALNSFSKELFEAHIRTCVVDGIKNGDEGVVDELVSSVGKFIG